MARRGVPLIAPALVRKAVQCINRAAAGVKALAESELALGVVVYTLSTETDLSRSEIARVLEGIGKLPEHCLAGKEPEEEEKKAPRQRGRRAKKKKKPGKK